MKLGAFTAALVALLTVPGPEVARANAPAVRTIRISYRAHDGLPRRAYVLLPAWYGPTDHPAVPLVISPHGRGVSAQENIRRWGRLPRRRRLRGDQSGRPGARADALLVGRPGRDARSRAHA